MGNVVLAVQDVSDAGITPSYTGSLTATTNTYQFVNDGRCLVHLKKSGAGACTVTISTFALNRGHALAAITLTVPATTGDIMWSKIAPSIFNDANGLVNMVFSETTGLTVAVVRI
jgi:hypothetical protein